MGAGDRGTEQGTGTGQQEGKRRDDLWSCRHTQPVLLEHGAVQNCWTRRQHKTAALLGRVVVPRWRNSTCLATELNSCPGEQNLERIPTAHKAVPHVLRGTGLPRAPPQPTLPAQILAGRWHGLCPCHHPGCHCHHPGCPCHHPVTSGSFVSYLLSRDNFPKSFTTSPPVSCPTPGLPRAGTVYRVRGNGGRNTARCQTTQHHPQQKPLTPTRPG